MTTQETWEVLSNKDLERILEHQQKKQNTYPSIKWWFELEIHHKKEMTRVWRRAGLEMPLVV